MDVPDADLDIVDDLAREVHDKALLLLQIRPAQVLRLLDHI